MALKTDSLLSISSNGVEYDKIGLSKTLNNYTFDELFNSVYCSADSNLIYHIASGGDITYYDYQDNSDNGHIPVKLTPVGQNRSAIYFPNDNPMNMPDGLYFRVIWLQRTRSGYDSYINKNSTGQFYKAITMLDSSHYVWECNPPTKQKNNYGANSWDAKDNLYCSESGALYYYDDIKSANPTRIVVNNIIPAIIFKFNEHNYILPYRQKMSYFFTKDNTHSESSYNPKTAKYCYDYDNSNPIAFPITTEQIYNHFNSSTGEFSSPLVEGSHISLGNSGYPSNGFSDTLKEHIMSIYSFGGNTSYNSYFGFDVYNYFKTKHECIKFWALGGLYIKADKIYKPIIKDGYVENFTDDLNKESEIDNWSGNTNHEVPDKSPGGSGSGDEDELEDSGMTLNANGNSFIRWFAVTGQNLLSLIESFDSETVPAGFVPLDHIVGVYQVPFNIPDFSNCGSLTNIFVGKYDTNVQGMPLLNQGSYSTTGIIASKYIEPTHNNFLDYEPYTSLSLYLPFCGSCNLDANLFVGKTVNVNYYFDIFSGDVIANVYANGTLYKTLSGNFTISQPITSQNVGLQKDTVIKGAVGVATNMLGTAGFAMSGNISGALSGAVGATISSISTYTHLNGISPVATKGGGGRSIFYTCKNIILYKSTAIENHGAYEKYRGKVCNYDSKLSECHGYTVVDNPHIEIKCTNTEKDEIKKLLEDGVILP